MWRPVPAGDTLAPVLLASRPTSARWSSPTPLSSCVLRWRIVMPPGSATGTVYLIDAHSLIFQVFHAIRDMTGPSGLPVNAIFGFTRDLLFLRRQRPDYLVCA